MLISRQESFDTLVSPELAHNMEAAKEYWQSESLDAVRAKTEAMHFVDLNGMLPKAYVLDPEVKNGNEIDNSRSIALSLPHLNGWTPHHYIRSRVLQQLVAPNSRVVVFPNNTFGQKNYDFDWFTDKALEQLNDGNMRPIAELQMRTLESIDRIYHLGAVSLTGYSSGARHVLSMANVGSSRINVTHVNADEAPSKTGRGPVKLQIDFMNSGTDVGGSVKDAGIPALSEAMKPGKLAADFAKFIAMNEFTSTGWRMQNAMKGDVHDDIYDLARSGQVALKIGYVAGSKLFDVQSNLPRNESDTGTVELVEYTGPEFRGHASADNVYIHALMANDGLKLA